MCRKNINVINKLVEKDNYLKEIFSKSHSYGTWLILFN